MAWKSFYRKYNTKKKFKRELSKHAKERDENLKKNWQRWDDEHRIGD